MGYETRCHARVDDHSGVIREAADSTVLIETDDLIVRGSARVKIARTSIESVATNAGVLTVTAPTATLSLSLGEVNAAKWRARLEQPPKRLIDKLDVRTDAKVWLFHVDDETLIGQLAAQTTNVVSGRSARQCDVVFVGVEQTEQLDRIGRAMDAIRDDGAIWVIHPKGKAGVADTAIFKKAVEIGLTYVKVARVSDTHTAEKLVRPLAGRRR